MNSRGRPEKAKPFKKVLFANVENTKNLSLYLKGNYISQKEVLTKDDEITYALILGFRFIKGIDIEKFKERYKK